jgi:hypothetical protein
MSTRNLAQSMRFVLGAVSACMLAACAQTAIPPSVQPAATSTADDRRDGAAWRGSAREGLLLSPAQCRPHTSM